MAGKFYISVDCEGCACVVGEPGKGLGTGANYAFACEQATKEANAAARALFDGGADEVVVWDSHGIGVNLHYEELDKRCRITLGSGHRGRFPGLDESYAAVLFIGYHAHENTANAVLAHTFSSVDFQYFKINGEEAGELAIDAAYAGEKGVPALFCAGDNIFLEEAEHLFGDIKTVETKQALSWTSAISKQPDQVCEEIYRAVLDSLGSLTELKPFLYKKPVTVEIRYKRMENAAKAALYDQNGRPFERKDAFTRSGVMRSVTDLF